MIYAQPAADAPLDQGDVIDGCPLLRLTQFNRSEPSSSTVECVPHRVVVLTQACDLSNQKATQAVVAPLFEAQRLVDAGLLKAENIRGPVRAGRVFGWYFLPAASEYRLPESVLDLRQLETVRIGVLLDLCRSGQRLARICPPYREHLAKHFADTYSRIGLPEPYATGP